MPFKRNFELERVDWPFLRGGAVAEKITAKYRKGAKCRISINNKNDKVNVNVFVESELVGFINYPSSLPIVGALDNGENIHAEIVKVEWCHEKSSVPVSVGISISSYSRRPRNIKNIVSSGYTEKNNPIDLGNRNSGTANAALSKNKHYILGIPFKEQRKKEIQIKSLAGVMGIYCIWNKTHETYIGQSKDIGRRIYQHCEALWGGHHSNKKLQEAWASGHSNFRFDVVKRVSQSSDLDKWEKYYIESYKTYTNGFNSTPDGLALKCYESPQVSGYNFPDNFYGRYHFSRSYRVAKSGVVRIKVGDEVWCYKTESIRHAELLVHWFADGREIIGEGYSWSVVL